MTSALLSGNADARAVVEEALTHKTARVRLAACRAIADVAGMAKSALPAPLTAHLDRMARHDHARDARVGAAVALSASAHASTEGRADQ